MAERENRHVIWGHPPRADGWPHYASTLLDNPGAWEWMRVADTGATWRIARLFVAPSVEENRALYDELRLAPSDALRGVLMLDATGKHPDVMLEILGLEPPAEGCGVLHWPRRPDGEADLHLVVRRARAHVRDSWVFGELLWDGRSGVDQIVNPTLARPANRRKDLLDAMAALDLLLAITHLGRPAEPSPDVRAEYLEAARRIVARGDVLSRDALADETLRSAARTYKRMKQHGVTLAALKRALRGE